VADPPRVPSSPARKSLESIFQFSTKLYDRHLPHERNARSAREKHLYINLKIMTYAPCLRTTPSESIGGGICLPTRNGEITTESQPLGFQNATTDVRMHARTHACIRTAILNTYASRRGFVLPTLPIKTDIN